MVVQALPPTYYTRGLPSLLQSQPSKLLYPAHQSCLCSLNLGTKEGEEARVGLVSNMNIPRVRTATLRVVDCRTSEVICTRRVECLSDHKYVQLCYVQLCCVCVCGSLLLKCIVTFIAISVVNTFTENLTHYALSIMFHSSWGFHSHELSTTATVCLLNCIIPSSARP